MDNAKIGKGSNIQKLYRTQTQLVKSRLVLCSLPEWLVIVNVDAMLSYLQDT